MASSEQLHAKLDALYDIWVKLTPDSPETAFEEFASKFSQDSTAWLKSMREIREPSLGREGVIEGIKLAVKDSQILERRVVARSASVSDTGSGKIFVESSNRVKVYGKDIETFPETAVVEFDSEGGLIKDFKLYSCRSPIVELIQELTGDGPYERHEGQCH
ncbi:hypothetical protein BX600DRAFT_500260 [Xylariales sp. PMI_506]|nr:hypothetical protein BX600DRAFT_500260 [Xylariales sp. PMI_506]